MHCVDLQMIAVLRETLASVLADTDELGFVLSQYTAYWSADTVVGGGATYIDRAVAMLTSKDKPFDFYQGYDLSQEPNFGAYVRYVSISETQLSFGDYGQSDKQLLTPTVYLKAEAMRIDTEGDASVLVFPNCQSIIDRVWRLQRVLNAALPGESFQVAAVMQTEDEIKVKLSAEVSNSAVLRGWEFRAFESGYCAELGGSGDTVQLAVELYSVGDIEVHKILATLLRYCIKKARTRSCEYQNFQAMRVSQSGPQPGGSGTDVTWLTTFNLSGVAQDIWIINKARLPEKITWAITATSPSTGESVTQGF